MRILKLAISCVISFALSGCAGFIEIPLANGKSVSLEKRTAIDSYGKKDEPAYRPAAHWVLDSSRGWPTGNRTAQQWPRQ
jgi:hypothetical protein